jgi:flagellar hook-length control protein FliK
MSLKSMNDSINPASSGSSPKAGVTEVLSNANAGLEGKEAVDSNDSAGSRESFHDSIQRVADQSRQENEKTEMEPGGNNLPVSQQSTAIPAEDDRSEAVLNFSFINQSQPLVQTALAPAQAAQLTTQPAQPSAQAAQLTTQLAQSSAQAAGLDIAANVGQALIESADELVRLGAGSAESGDELTVSLSTASQLLKIAPNAGGQKARLSSSNIAPLEKTLDKPLISAPELSALNTEQLELSAHKGQGLMAAASAQQILPAIQSSLLLQTASAQGELAMDSLPLLVNTPTGNASAFNLQAIPQAEIVETFARPAWSQGMGKQIVWLAQQNISSAEIRLNPAHLGPIEVRLEMADDQVNVALSSRHAVVREAMEMALPKLREMFESSGLSLADTDISQHSFAEQREQKTAGDNSSLTADSVDQAVTSEIGEQLMQQTAVSTGMVDYYI